MSKTVLIAIQARSGSTRLPRKAFELIAGKMMLDRVIDACKKAAKYCNNNINIKVRVAVLTPENDPIIEVFGGRCDIMEGPEKDVLTRYRMALEKFQSDYVVRITGDCPMIPPYMISRLIKLALERSYDYVSNVDERFRTSVDGADCEVISARLLKEIHQLAVSESDREHVTTMVRRVPPAWAKIGAVVNYFDNSEQKLSVDTPDDLERVRKAQETAEDKYRTAVNTYGQTQVHLL